jgi:TolB-like protein/Tfp pilus assembly protein PilF
MNNLLSELRRRNIFRVAGVYGVVGWLLMQAASIAFPIFGAPDWVLKSIIALLMIGFPLALLLAWAFEMTPAGVKRTEAVTAADSLTASTGRGLDYVILAGLVLIGIMIIWQGARFPADSFKPQMDNSLSKRVQMSAAIAVLPFRNLGDAGSSGFTDGLHDDLLTQLSKINALRVISRTSVMGYQGTSKNIRTIGEELGVTHIMEGGVQRAGNRVRINVQLIDAVSDEHLWAETFERALTVEEIFKVQSDIARAITTAMRAELTPKEAAEIATAPTEDLVAYEAYLQSRLLIQRGGSLVLDQLNQVIASLQNAVARDPDFAQAWALLAEHYADLFWFHGDESAADVSERIVANIERLKGRDHYLTNRAKGIYLYHGRRRLHEASPFLDAAMALRPNDALAKANLGFIERRLGDFEASSKHLAAALKINPLYSPASATLGDNYIWLQDWTAFDAFVKTGYLRPFDNALRRQVQLLKGYQQIAKSDDAIRRYVKANNAYSAHKDFDSYFWFFNGPATAVYPLYDRIIQDAMDDMVAIEKSGQNVASGEERLITILLCSAVHARSLGDDARMNAALDQITSLDLDRLTKTRRGENPWRMVELKIMVLALQGQGDAAREAARTLERIIEKSEDGIAAAEAYTHLAQVGVLLRDLDMITRNVEKGVQVSPAHNPLAAIMKLPDYEVIKAEPEIIVLVDKYAPDFAGADAVFSKYIDPAYFYGPEVNP